VNPPIFPSYSPISISPFILPSSLRFCKGGIRFLNLGLLSRTVFLEWRLILLYFLPSILLSTHVGPASTPRIGLSTSFLPRIIKSTQFELDISQPLFFLNVLWLIFRFPCLFFNHHLTSGCSPTSDACEGTSFFSKSIATSRVLFFTPLISPLRRGIITLPPSNRYCGKFVSSQTPGKIECKGKASPSFLSPSSYLFFLDTFVVFQLHFVLGHFSFSLRVPVLSL